MSIILAMPGKREHQEQFWQRCIMETRLEFYTELAFQANAAWNDMYPGELHLEYPRKNHIAVQQWRHTRSRFRSEYQPKPFTHVYLDYEPYRKKPDGTRYDWWLNNKAHDGYSKYDHRALREMCMGVLKGTSPHLAYSVYRTPTLPTRRNIEAHVVKSARASTDLQQWVWMDAYIRDDNNWDDYRGRLVRDFGALSKLGRRVIPFIWPKHSLTPSESQEYMKHAVDALSGIPGCNHIGVWVDCNHRNVAERQINNFLAGSDHVREFMEK